MRRLLFAVIAVTVVIGGWWLTRARDPARSVRTVALEKSEAVRGEQIETADREPSRVPTQMRDPLELPVRPPPRPAPRSDAHEEAKSASTDAPLPTIGAESALRGLGVVEKSAVELEALGIPRGTTGVMVSSVDPGSSAAEAHLEPGDVIVRVDRTSIGTVDGLTRAVGDRRHTVLLFYRKGTPLQLVLHAPFRDAP